MPVPELDPFILYFTDLLQQQQNTYRLTFSKVIPHPFLNGSSKGGVCILNLEVALKLLQDGQNFATCWSPF